MIEIQNGEWVEAKTREENIGNNKNVPKLSEESVRKFLDAWNYPITLHTIDKGMISKTAHTFEEAISFVKEHQEKKRNCYFTINRSSAVDSKSSEAEITHLVSFQVDIDSSESLPISQIKDMIEKNYPKDLPKPSMRVFSGGGVHLYYFLKDPIPVIEENRDRLKEINQALASRLKGDSCHDLSRIFRVAGTVNYPNEKKIAKGREVKLCVMYRYDESAKYDLKDFDHLKMDVKPLLKNSDESFKESHHEEKDLENILIKKYKVGSELIEFLKQDKNAQEPRKFRSEETYTRSEKVASCVTHLLEKKVPENIIKSVIKSNSFSLSDRYREKPQDAVEKEVDRISSKWLQTALMKYEDMFSTGDEAYIASLEEDAKEYDVISTGFRRIDDILGGGLRLKDGSMTSIGARTGVGKTSLSLNFVLSALEQGKRVLFVTLEMTRENVMKKIAYIKTGKIDQTLSKEENQKLKNLIINNEPIKLEDVVDYVDTVQRILKFDLICVDYCQKIKTKDSSQMRHLDVGKITGDLKELALKHRCHVLLPAQLNRNSDSHPIGEVFLNQFRESASIEMDSDTCILMYLERDEEDKKQDGESEYTVKLKVAKQRNGRLGKVDLNFKAYISKFEEIEEEVPEGYND